MGLKLAAVVLALLPSLAQANGAPQCFSYAKSLCECSALLAVLKGGPIGTKTSETDEWRRLSDSLRHQSYPVMGKRLGDLFIDAQIDSLLSATDSKEARIEFGQLMSRCSAYLKADVNDPKVIVGP